MDNLLDPERITFDLSSEADLEAVAALYQQHYPNLSWSREYLNWQYHQNPAGVARNWVARSQGKIIASYTAVPFETLANGKICRGWRMQDLLTRPEYGGLGIYHTLARMANQFVMAEEHPFNFAFPNERSQKGFVKTGWHDVCRIPLWVLELNESRVAAKNIQAVAISKFDTRVDDIWKSYSRRIDFAVHRTAAFLNWRYLSRPRAKYFPFILSSKNGQLILILKYYDREDGSRWAHICDLFQSADDLNLTESALLQTLQFAAEHRCGAISCWMRPEALALPILEKFGFVLQRDLPRWFVINANGPAAGERAHTARWHLSMGDSDVY